MMQRLTLPPLFLIAAIALAGGNFCFSFLADILAHGASRVIALLELALIITSDKTFISSCINQLTFASALLSCHYNPLNHGRLLYGRSRSRRQRRDVGSSRVAWS